MQKEICVHTYSQKFNPSDITATGIFHEKQINTDAADVLAPCIIRPSAAPGTDYVE